MTHAFMTDEEREESIIERRERERADGKVENDENIPLIPNVKLDVRKTIHEIEVWKVDPPNNGYKGTVNPTASFQTIAQLYGNGTYDFHAKAQDGKVLRRNTGVRISWTPEQKSPEPEVRQSEASDPSKLLDWQARQHEREQQRVETFGREAMNTTRDMAKEQMLATRENAALTIQRDREFFQGILSQQREFFAGMMQMNNQMFQQSITHQREDFNRTLQVVSVSQERVREANNPELLLTMFERGLQLAAGGEDDEDDEEKPAASEPWVDVIKAGAEAVKDIAGAAKAQALAPALIAKKKSLPPPKQQISALTTPANSQPQPEKTKKRKSPFTREEMLEILRAKAIMDQKGLDFAQTVRNATLYITGSGEIGQTESNGAESEQPTDSEETDFEDAGDSQDNGSQSS